MPGPTKIVFEPDEPLLTVLNLVEFSRFILEERDFNQFRALLGEIGRKVPSLINEPGLQGLNREKAIAFYTEILDAIDQKP